MALYLYYDSKKGLTKTEGGVVCGEYILEHNEKGSESPLHEQTMEIPARNVKIVVRTNLHYGSKSYMNASITMMDKRVLNFHDTSLKHSVNIVYAEPGNWDMLFDGIINLYNSIYDSEASINEYFNALDDRIARFVGNISDVFDRIAEISDGLADSIYGDSILIEKRMLGTCRLLFQMIAEKWRVNPMNKITQKIEVDMHKIVNYLTRKDEMLDVFFEWRHQD